jgi:EamA domain-containing membrane protein RarD
MEIKINIEKKHLYLIISLFVVLAGIIFLGEKGHMVRKIVSAILTVVAVYLMR